MEMPGYLDYQKMATMDPVAYKQAMDQVGLAQMYQTQKQKEAELKNQQSERMNPMLLEQQGLQNLGTGLDNTRKGQVNEDTGMSLGIRKATYPQEMEAKIRDFASKATDEQIKSAQQKIELDFMSGDPVRIKRAQQGEQFLATVRAEQRKHQQAVSLEQERSRSHLASTNATIAGQKDLEKMRIDAGKYDKKAGISWAVKFGSLPPATRVGNLQAALTANKDPATGETMDAETRSMYEAMLQQDMATLNAANNARGGNTGVTLNIPEGGGSPALINKTPVTVNPNGNSPAVPKIQTPQDQQALVWANANPNDPRAVAIKKKLGVN